MKRFLTVLALALALPLCLGAAPARITVSGHIYDAATGETLIGAGVVFGEASVLTGAATNNYGYYSLTLTSSAVGARDSISLSYSYVGYRTEVIEIPFVRDTVIDVSLTRSLELEGSVVTARRDAGIKSSYLGAIDVPLSHIKNVPSLLGEQDIIKSLQLLPGVQGGNEGFAGLYVRGGGPDENLILLDGVPIYNTDHILGLFSVFQPDAVKKVTLYKGSFPARYGGRVSSIIDIRTNDGNTRETHGSIGVGVVSDKIHIEGPILKDRLSYSLSARGMHTAVFAPLLRLALKENYTNYYFYDLNGKLSWRAGERDRIYLGAYFGADNLKYEQKHEYHSENSGYYGTERQYHSNDALRVNWGNSLVDLRWNHIFSSRLFSNVTVAWNSYSSVIAGSSHERGTDDGVSYVTRYGTDYRSGIRDLSAKMDFDYTPSPRHLVKFGAEYIYHSFIPATISTRDYELRGYEQPVDTTIRYTSQNPYHGHDFSVYGEDDIYVSEHLTLNPGVRVALFAVEGGSYLAFQPRVSAKLSLPQDVSLKAGYARMAQYVHLLSSSQLSLPMDLWVPITKDVKPVYSDQFSVGVYYAGLKDWEFSVEGYWKEMYNILEYKDGTFSLGNTASWESMVAMGRGRAVGLEFFAQKIAGSTTGWISYTLAKSDRWFPDGSINLGQKFPYKYDRRHSVNICVNHSFSKRWDINAVWSFASGTATTFPMRKTVVVDPDTGVAQTADFVGSRNNYRLPPSHRLNLGVNLHCPARHGESVWNFSIYNAYNYMNPNFVFLNTTFEDGETKYYMEKVTVLPIIPSISYTYNF